MNALLLVAHGSRKQQSNDEVALIANKLKKTCAEQYQIVHASFLELAEPSITESIHQCIDDGANRIVILPYFLNSGLHVTEDIPEIINASKEAHPNIDIVVASHIGAADQMMDLLIATANSAIETD